MHVIRMQASSSGDAIRICALIEENASFLKLKINNLNAIRVRGGDFFNIDEVTVSTPCLSTKEKIQKLVELV